jgi:hypothetical protein
MSMIVNDVFRGLSRNSSYNSPNNKNNGAPYSATVNTAARRNTIASSSNPSSNNSGLFEFCIRLAIAEGPNDRSILCARYEYYNSKKEKSVKAYAIQ